MMQTIKLGAEGNAVRALRYLIGNAARGEALSSFDAALREALRGWQGLNGLTADGICGPKTWARLAANAPRCSTSVNRISAATCALQELLSGLKVDGIYGTQTKRAVAALQAGTGSTADGICGTAVWTALISGTGVVRYRQPVDYKQYDSRWGAVVYTSCGNKSQTIRNSGCGPTAMADIVATLIDPGVTPKTLAALAVSNGYRTKSSGTAWGFFEFIRKQYGFSRLIETGTLAGLKACLDAGGYVVCSMGPGYWTSGGHYICAYKYDDNYIYCNDPASAIRKKQAQSAFLAQRKRFFCFYK